jgi:tRNA(Arg) A34 adenosine deaminase TadA
MNKQPNRIMTQRDARFVQLAMEEAKKSSVCMQHGCIAVMHGKIIARSFNTTCRVSPTIWWSCHAEMAAIKKINEPDQCRQRHARRQRITLYVVRLTRGELHSSAPCLHCMRAIQLCPCIKRIIYSEADGTITRCSPDKYCTQYVSWGMRGERSSPNPSSFIFI